MALSEGLLRPSWAFAALEKTLGRLPSPSWRFVRSLLLGGYESAPVGVNEAPLPPKARGAREVAHAMHWITRVPVERTPTPVCSAGETVA